MNRVGLKPDYFDAVRVPLALGHGASRAGKNSTDGEKPEIFWLRPACRLGLCCRAMSNLTAPVRPLLWLTSFGDAVAEVSWSPDGTLIAVGGVDGRLALIEATTGRVVHALTAHEGGLFHCAFSPTEPLLATCGQDGQARLWNPATGERVKELAVGTAWVEQLVWSPVGGWLAVAGGRKLRLWNPTTGVVHESADHRSTVSALTFSHDGEKLASACYGGVELWEVSAGRHSGNLPWKTSLVSVSWSPDGRWVAAGTQELAVQIWELPFRAGEELAMSGYAAKVRELAWHHSSRYLATGGGTEIMVWDCAGKGPAGTAPRILQGHQSRVTALDYPRVGHTLASGGLDGLVLLWNAGRSSEPLRQFKLPAPVTALRWSPDGTQFAVGCRDGSLGVGLA
jgi:WD40 repeat protein